MKMPEHAIRHAQKLLGVAVDGVVGPKTWHAANDGMKAKGTGWWGERIVIGYLQEQARAAGIETGAVDGLWGPQTEYAVSVMIDAKNATWRDDLSAAGKSGFPEETRTQIDLIAFYGPPGKSDGSFRPPLVKVPLPWTMKLAWDTRLKRSFLYCHARAAPSLARVLARIRQTHTDAQISALGIDLFGGDYNPRKMKGASRSSLHSWGIAYDFDPERNGLHMNGAQARLGQPDAVPFWQAWEAEGWCSLGRARNYDWMHVQAAPRAY